MNDPYKSAAKSAYSQFFRKANKSNKSKPSKTNCDMKRGSLSTSNVAKSMNSPNLVSGRIYFKS